MRVSTRFEVFKRDGFTCQYCGRKTPDVVLEVDHIIPRAEGGGDEIENLLTACWDCNRGKGARLLDDRAPVPAVEEQMEMLRERAEQLRVYHTYRDELVARRNNDLRFIECYWSVKFGYDGDENAPYVPYTNVLRDAINRLGKFEVMEAMDLTADRFDCYLSIDACRYFGGVIKNKIAESEGRAIECARCHERIVLTREQVAKHGRDAVWSHTKCVEQAD